MQALQGNSKKQPPTFEGYGKREIGLEEAGMEAEDGFVQASIACTCGGCRVGAAHDSVGVSNGVMKGLMRNHGQWPGRGRSGVDAAMRLDGPIGSKQWRCA